MSINRVVERNNAYILAMCVRGRTCVCGRGGMRARAGVCVRVLWLHIDIFWLTLELLVVLSCLVFLIGYVCVYIFEQYCRDIYVCKSILLFAKEENWNWRIQTGRGI